MKAVLFIAGMVVVGAVGGLAYGEYDRTVSGKRNARAHIFEVTKVYEKNPGIATDATIAGVKQCSSELHFVEMPPILSEFLGKSIAADYEIVKRHGLKANEFGNELEDLRNALSNEYYDTVDEEIQSLSPDHAKRILKIVREFQTQRKGLTSCVHEKAFVGLANAGEIRTR